MHATAFLHARRRRLAFGDRPLSREAFLRGYAAAGGGARGVLEEAGLARRGAARPSDDVAVLARALKAFPLEVRGIGDERQCQVTARRSRTWPRSTRRTLEARAVARPASWWARRFDVDAPCGGYNLHWAWASGMLAGRGAVARLTGLDTATQDERR